MAEMEALLIPFRIAGFIEGMLDFKSAGVRPRLPTAVIRDKHYITIVYHAGLMQVICSIPVDHLTLKAIGLVCLPGRNWAEWQSNYELEADN